MYCYRVWFTKWYISVFVKTQIFTNIAYIIPTAAYALIMYITAFIFIYLLKN